VKPMNYTAMALEVVPIGSHPSVVTLREEIAKILESTVKAATDQQREKEFPELATVRVDMGKKNKELEEWRAKLKEYEDEQKKRVARNEEDHKKRTTALDQREKVLKDLTDAFDDYMRWMDGEGEVDENSKRFEALRTAYKTYKEKKK
jgi:hypothetical protein